MSFYSKRWMVGGVGLVVAGQASASAINLEVFQDGAPMMQAEVFLDGQSIGSITQKGKFWYESVSAGRHSLEVKTLKKNIPINFKMADEQVALISINCPKSGAKASSSVQIAAYADVNVSQNENGQTVTTLKDESADASTYKGTISGQVNRSSDGKGVRNVRVAVEGTGTETTTDRYGRFNLDLVPGLYQLRLEHPTHRKQTLVDLRVVAKMTVNVDAQLITVASEDSSTAIASHGIEEVTVIARYTANNPIALERMSASIVDNIDFAQVARFDDSSVSAAISRVVGVSLENGRYAVVRGLKSRYQSGYLNGGILPSTDPSRRDLPLDIFPSSIMQSLSLQKTATADVPGSATAGHIDMKTKAITDESFFKASWSVGAGDGLNDDALRTDGGGRDWTGRDDGTREMPDEIAALDDIYVTQNTLTLEQQNAVSKSVALRYDVYKGKVGENYSLDISGGNSWEFDNGQRLGFLSAFRYSNKWSNRSKDQARYSEGVLYDDNGNIVRDENGLAIIQYYPNAVGVIQDTDNTIDTSGLINMQWDINDDHRLGLNNLIVRHSIDSAESTETHRQGTQNPIGDYGFTSTIVTSIEWTEEQVSSHQLLGDHRFVDAGDLELNWQYTLAVATYDKPDAIRYTYQAENARDSFAFFAINRSTNRTSWEEMKEDSKHYSFDIKKPFDGYEFSGEFRAGVNKLSRDREGFQDGYAFVDYNDVTAPDIVKEDPNPNNIIHHETETGRAYYLQTFGVNKDADKGFVGTNYLVEQTINAKYLLADLELWEKVRFIVGARQEDMVTDVEMYAFTPEPLTRLIDEERDLYSLGLTYFFTDQWQLRSSYSETVSWPEIFEVLPRYFRDLTTLSDIIGNPDLKPADIKNYDMRLEWYPSSTESISFALFYKNLDNPIENTFAREGEDFDSYTFANVPGATLEGAEIDMRTEYTLGPDQGHEVFVQFNYADINSSVNLPEDQVEADRNRGLQGQPDYLINLQIGYDHIDTNQELTLVYNRKGPELFIISPAKAEALPNVYEKPFDDLRLVYKKHWDSGLALSLTLSNLLDSTRSYQYEGEGLPYLDYKPGRSFKLKLSFGL
jgi:outer membrane receptor protein involved in Fe transport